MNFADMSAAMGFVPQQQPQQHNQQQQLLAAGMIAVPLSLVQQQQVVQQREQHEQQQRGPLPPVSCARKEEVQVGIWLGSLCRWMGCSSPHCSSQVVTRLSSLRA
jgi:hypothetical protein